MTKDDYEVDEFSGANIQMLKSAEIQDIMVIPSNYINSRSASYTITMVPSVPVTKDNIIIIEFPS